MQERRTDPEVDEEGVAAVRRARWYRNATLFISCAVVFLDQISKSWAYDHFLTSPFVVAGPIELFVSLNPGVAFGIGEGVAPILIAVALIGGALALFGIKLRINKAMIVGSGLILGGAVSNVIDRLVRGHGGAVIDFIVVWRWPVFNLADASIVVGAVLLVLWGARQK